MMDQELQKKIGQLFVVGFDGPEPNEHLRFILEELKISNLIFFSRNIVDHDQTAELCSRIIRDSRQHSAVHPFMTIDQEGGVVSRLHGDLNTYPGAMALAALGNEEAPGMAARITAGHLRSLGFNMNLAPVCDINSNPANPIIGPRSYGDKPEQVARLAAAAMKGYMAEGVLPVLKHFPGHGDCSVDSHINLPIIHHARSLLDDRELLPFRHCIAEGAPAVMIAHLLMSGIDSSGLPASLSPEIIDGLLRSSLGFEGLVLTDCLEMMGISGQFAMGEAVVLACEAGADLIFISHSPEKQEEGYRALHDALASGRISEARIDQSLERIGRCKGALGFAAADGGAAADGADGAGSPGWRGWQGKHPEPALQEMSRRSLTLIRNQGFLPESGLPDKPETLILSIDRPEQFIGENSVSGGRPIERLRQAFPRAVFRHVMANVAEADILSAAGSAGSGGRILITTADAGLYPEAMAAIRKLCEGPRPVGVAVMRSPYEAAEFAAADFLLLAYEDTVLAVESLIALLRGELQAEGRCPVRIPGLP